MQDSGRLFSKNEKLVEAPSSIIQLFFRNDNSTAILTGGTENIEQ